MTMRPLIALTLLCVLAGLARAAEPVKVSSPDGEVQLRLTPEPARLRYDVTFGGAPVVEQSAMSFSIDGTDLAQGAEVTKVEPYEGQETYATRGVKSVASDHHRGARVRLKHVPSGTEYLLDVRVFNDAAAFRLILEAADDRQRVPDERTVFTLPAGATVWYHNLRGHYEGDYERQDVADVESGQWAAPPLTCRLPDGVGYAAISEAALVNYSGMALESAGNRSFVVGLGHRQPVSYPYELRYSKEDVERLSHPAKIAGTITTPWRVIMVARDLNGLVNSDVITNLSSPPDPKYFPDGVATDWVKPGRAVWRYLDNPQQSAPADPLAQQQSQPQATPGTTRPRSRVTPEDMKTFSRLAGELGFEYNVLEGFWRRWSDEEIRDVVDYSRQQGVGLFVWVHSRNLFDPAERAALFQRCRDTGIVGLKVDFFDHEHKEVIDLYHALLREGAEHRLLFNFHGANKPAGEARTWPNELVREAVRGMEASRLHDRATHNTTIPFTRYTVGHGEYTPVVFGERRGNTTWAHQVATAAVFTAPLLTYGAHPQKMLENPAAEMLKSIPATWDETIVLTQSEIGELAVYARRKGDAWFLAVLNGTEARTIQVSLKFLGEGEYRALIVRDHSADAAAVEVEENVAADRKRTLPITLRSGGGFVARFTK